MAYEAYTKLFELSGTLQTNLEKILTDENLYDKFDEIFAQVEDPTGADWKDIIRLIKFDLVFEVDGLKAKIIRELRRFSDKVKVKYCEELLAADCEKSRKILFSYILVDFEGGWEVPKIKDTIMKNFQSIEMTPRCAQDIFVSAVDHRDFDSQLILLKSGKLSGIPPQALDLACEFGRHDVVEELLTKPEVTNTETSRPIMIAAGRNDTKLVDIMLQKYAKNIKFYGEFATLFALNSGSIDAAARLLQVGEINFYITSAEIVKKIHDLGDEKFPHLPDSLRPDKKVRVKMETITTET